MADTPNDGNQLSDDDEAPGGTVLLIVDMISDWRFPDAQPLIAPALAASERIGELKARCRRRGIPVIYANDNHGRWRSDFRALVQGALEREGAARRITEALLPGEDDYFVLKPRHSAFFATPLELLLQQLAADRLVLTGITADQCVLSTAFDAKMRDYEVIVPPDCVAAQTEQRRTRAVQHLTDVLRLQTVDSGELELPRRGAGDG